MTESQRKTRRPSPVLIAARITDDEMLQVKAAAAEYGFTVSEFVRRLVLPYADSICRGLTTKEQQ